ncbi:hypothetical protein G6F56_000772 [Rhizopus delemar]|nr:hypothetical protein G6F56_000772 [Rhizopus delemar]
MSTIDSSSIISLETMDIDSDKDLIINSLRESLQIHKEILERIQNEKETFQQLMDKKKQEQAELFEQWKFEAISELEREEKRCSDLQKNMNDLKQELDVKKEAYQKLEANFYSHVKTIRVTDDDLSTIQLDISHLLNQLNNACMGLKSKMDRKGGTEFVYGMYPDKADFIGRFMTPVDGLLDISYITLFVEKYLIQILLTQVIDVPIHLGVSINDSFREIEDWMSERNSEWSDRLRQQVCALVVQQPGPDEEEWITKAKDELLVRIVEDLSTTYPLLKQDAKKIENLITRSLKLNLATKGQEIKIQRLSIVEGVTQFDSLTMKATAKGKPNGIVGLAITPIFIARDELDCEHGFTIPGKVFCIEQGGDELKSQEANENSNFIENNEIKED